MGGIAVSQAYHIALTSTVNRRVTSADQVSYPLTLEPLLPQEELVGLLRQALLADGFVPLADAPQRLTAQGPAGETLEVDLTTLLVTASLAEDRELSLDVNAQGGGYSRREAVAEAQALLQRETERAEGSLTAQQQKLQRILTARLAASEGARLARLHGVLEGVYGEALKRKAHTLGDVVALEENRDHQGNYRLVIKVER
ncbi:MAG: hypothetical protein ACFCBW_16065 [Candidatus Competibacterales bacterium]